MTVKEYFSNWIKVIDLNELGKIVSIVSKMTDICPQKDKVFRAFRLCKYTDCKVIILSQDPYPQKGIATGIAFGNEETDDKLSPSLKVIKECVINYNIPHNLINFDNSLESWCKQGVLMLNSALTCKMNHIGSHVNLWRPFISSFLKNMSYTNPGIIYALFGEQAKTFKPYIHKEGNYIYECNHPSYYYRTNTPMPNIFKDINDRLKLIYNENIEWFKEENL